MIEKETLAETGIEGDNKKRIYNGGKSIGPIVGYSERTLGRAGLEDVYMVNYLE